MIQRTTSPLRCAAVLASMSLANMAIAPAFASTPMGSYAVFEKTRRTDPEKFRGTKRLQGLDSQRRLSGYNLVLAARGQDGAVGVELTNLATTALQTIFEVRDVYVPPCTAGAAARYVVSGRFFNMGSPTPGDATGDVRAYVQAIHSTSSTVARSLRIEAGIEACGNADCSSRTPLGSPAFLGNIVEDGLAAIKLAWEADADRFLFQLNWRPEVAISYSVSDANAAGAPTRAIEAETQSACTGATSHAIRIDTRTRYVWVNWSAL